MDGTLADTGRMGIRVALQPLLTAAGLNWRGQPHLRFSAVGFRKWQSIRHYRRLPRTFTPPVNLNRFVADLRSSRASVRLLAQLGESHVCVLRDWHLPTEAKTRTPLSDCYHQCPPSVVALLSFSCPNGAQLGLKSSLL